MFENFLECEIFTFLLQFSALQDGFKTRIFQIFEIRHFAEIGRTPAVGPFLEPRIHSKFVYIYSEIKFQYLNIKFY